MTTVEVTTYEIATGRVRRVIDGDLGTVLANLKPGQSAVAGRVDGGRFWIDHATGAAVPLTPMTPVFDGLSVSGLPDGATINGTPATEWEPPAGEIAPRVLIEAPRHVSVDAVLTDYRAKRAAAYPAIGDQLDALNKAIAALAAGEPVPADAAAILATVANVKATIPKAV
jgi:hypothetical protein